MVHDLLRVVLMRAATCAVTLGLTLGVACSSTPAPDYGELACFDVWPDAPAPVAPKASLPTTPAVAWQTPLLTAIALDDYRGIALSGDRVITTAGASVVALDRATGAQVFSKPLESQQGLVSLGPPTVDEKGEILVQSPDAVTTLSPDGTVLSTSGPSGQWSSGGDGPGVGTGFPLALVGSEILAFSTVDQEAVDPVGAVLWSSKLSAFLSMGHFGFGFDEAASYVVDLRTGAPAGRLRAANGRDVWVRALLAGRGPVAIELGSNDAVSVVGFDTCGKEAWTTPIPDGCVAGHGVGFGVVGPGEIMYFGSGSCGDPAVAYVVGIDPSGRIVGGPVDAGFPWAVGADGTVYTISGSESNTTLNALSPKLAPLWTLAIDARSLGRGLALADDGLLYARVQTQRGDETILAVQTTSPGLAASSWPTSLHDNRASNWGGGSF